MIQDRIRRVTPRKVDPLVVIEVACCRVWRVAAGMPWGRCGRCRTKPAVEGLARFRRP